LKKKKHIGKLFWNDENALFLSIIGRPREELSSLKRDNQHVRYHSHIDLPSIMCHNIKNPLNALLGLIQNIDSKDGELKPAVNHLYCLLHTLDHIFDYFGILEGKIKLFPQKIIPIRLFKEIEATMKIYSDQEQVKIIFNDINAEASKFLHTDPNKIKQILLSLLGVSFKMVNQGNQ
jgi:signal transduction histidine kinase